MKPRDLFTGGLLLGAAIGVGVAFVGPMLWRAARPAAKQALRAGLLGFAQARAAAGRMGEEVEDLVAEVIHEAKDLAEKVMPSSGESVRAEKPADGAPPQA